MAKICGYISSEESKETVEECLQSMMGVLKHDSSSNEICLRLEYGEIALIVAPFSNQAQAIWKEDRSSCLVFCGDVIRGEGDRKHLYEDENDISSDNDAAFLLQAIETGGKDVLGQLNGVFCFAYVDMATHSLTVVNDRYGFMPLYYYSGTTRFIFASEVKAIVRVLGKPEYDWESFADFFYIGHMMGEKTLFKDVHALAPAQVLTYHNGELLERTYYDPAEVGVLSREDVSTDRVASLFLEAVRRRIRRDAPNTLLLSGGFDSRLILGALTRLGVTPSIVSLEHASEQQGADGKLAARMANVLGLVCDYRKSRDVLVSSGAGLEVFYILDGMVPVFSLFIGEIYPELDNRLGMVWDGLSLDVALGGSHQTTGGVEQNLKHFIKKRLLNRLLLRIILTPEKFRSLDKSFVHRLQDEVAKIPASPNRFLHFLLRNRTRRRIAPNPYTLFAVKVDPVTPATDIDFLDYVLRIPSEVKLEHRFYLELLRKHFPFLTEVPVVSGGSVFDFGIGFQKKPAVGKERVREALKSVVKVAGWISARFRRGSRRLADDFPTADLMIVVLQIKHFDRPFYRKRLLRRVFAAYRRGNGIYHKLFTIVFYIELWHLLFIDKDSPIYFNPKKASIIE